MIRVQKSLANLAAFALILLGVTACGGATSDTSMPVALPVPFSGSFSPDSQVIVANGQTPQDFSKGLVLAQVFGSTFPVFDSTGNNLGHISFDFEKASSFKPCGDKTCFTVPMTLIFNDGNILRAESMQFFDFPYDPAAAVVGVPNPPPIQNFGPNAYATKGVASGVITAGTGNNASAVNHLMDYRYVHIWNKPGTIPTLQQIFYGTVIIYR